MIGPIEDYKLCFAEEPCYLLAYLDSGYEQVVVAEATWDMFHYNVESHSNRFDDHIAFAPSSIKAFLREKYYQN